MSNPSNEDRLGMLTEVIRLAGFVICGATAWRMRDYRVEMAAAIGLGMGLVLLGVAEWLSSRTKAGAIDKLDK